MLDLWIKNIPKLIIKFNYIYKRNFYQPQVKLFKFINFKNKNKLSYNNSNITNL